MRSIEELGQFYTDNLLPDLKQLDLERKKLVKKVCIIDGTILLVMLFFIVLLVFGHSTSNFFDLIIPLCFVAIIAVYKKLTANYVNDFKSAIIEKIIVFIDPDLLYKKKSFISKVEFITSMIFTHIPDIHRGDDFVEGTIGKTNIRFSEIHSEYKTRDSKSRTSWNTIFKGLFFISDFNKNFNGETFVLPDTAEKLLGNLGTFFQKANSSKGQLVKLEDPEFEKEFVVYSNNQVEARYILSTSLMKRIVDFKKKTDKKVYLSFAGSKIHVAISYSKDLFEPRFFRTIVDFTPVFEYYQDLALAIGIVEDLNLNLRIWTKE